MHDCVYGCALCSASAHTATHTTFYLLSLSPPPLFPKTSSAAIAVSIERTQCLHASQTSSESSSVPVSLSVGQACGCGCGCGCVCVCVCVYFCLCLCISACLSVHGIKDRWLPSSASNFHARVALQALCAHASGDRSTRNAAAAAAAAAVKQ